MQDTPQTAGQAVACPRCGGQFVAGGGSGEHFDPYYTWLGIPPSEQPANHYRLLGIQLFESNVNVIENAADRQMKHLQSFKIGAKAALSQRLLTEVSAARVQLLDPARKAIYDAGLRSRTAPVPALPQLPQLPEAGTPFTALADSAGPPPVVNRSGHRLPRRTNSASPLSTILIVFGGCAGLVMGGLIIFYLTGQDFLGLSGKLKQQPPPRADATPVPMLVRPKKTVEESPVSPATSPATESPLVKPPERPLERAKTKTIVKSPTPQPAEPVQVVEEPKPPVTTPPPSLELFSEAPRFLKLPPLASSAPFPWFSLSRDPEEPLTLILHADAATLPAGVNLRIRENSGGRSWTIEQLGDLSASNQNTAIGQIRLTGRELTFAWSALSTEAEIRRQLANCLLEITCGDEFRNLQLREPLIMPALAIDFDHEKQTVELNISDTPSSGKLLARFQQLDGFTRGPKIRGDNDTIPFTRPIEIQFSEFKGPEIEFRFVRQPNKLIIQVKPQFVEAANRKFDLTVPSLEKITRAQERIRAEAHDTLVKAQANLATSQSTLQNLNNNRPTDVQGQALWNSRVSAAMTAVNHLSGVIANANEKLGESQVRLAAVPEIRNFLEAHKSARIRYKILAKAGVGEIVLVDGTGQ
ncbi:MAG TPA: hypothetical protein VGI40_01985 [Pirellulaceae bacterium]|jgi:hypothetical protein